MRTFQRLNEAYDKAKYLSINENSKFIFFSDCHRGDGSLSDEFVRNKNIFIHALEYYYKNDYTYVEAGDGDELWEHRNARHILTANKDVYTVIRKFHSADKLIILYGNHNIYLKNQEYVIKNYYKYYSNYKEISQDFLTDLHPVESLILKNEKTDQEILIVHGHQGDFSNDQFWYFTMLTLKYFWRFLHAFGAKNPASPVKNVHKRHKIEKNFSKWIQQRKKTIICGHTHRAKYPKNGDLPYFNIGSCIYPSHITGIEIIDGNIQMVLWKVIANEQGFLEVIRQIIRGPDSLEKFDTR
ncbi:MAG: metallophosphoesterase family protein [Clostridiales bacterium]|nr:metallophosphoesterase family protein [Clostridiales bacterium]